MPLAVTLIIAKTALKLSRWLGKGGGSALPGLIAETIDIKTTHKLASRLSKGVVLVTGTNGKTTTTKLILDMLERGGKKVVTNRSGSNLSRGILSSLIEQASITGHIDADIGLFEVDEASMPAVAASTKPGVIVVLNLFRDQLDRYGELNSTASMLAQVLAEAKAEIYLNADDPLVASLATNVGAESKVRYFGIQASESKKLAHDMASDSHQCPYDGSELVYTQRFFGHIGHYRCPKGDFGRPQPTIAIKRYQANKPVAINGLDVNLPLPGIYNAYNAVAAFGVASQFGIKPEQAVKSLEGSSAAFGRVELLTVEGRKVYLLLIKNPTGFNQVIQTFLLEKPGVVVMAINDNFADGRDVSWLWDVAIEELASAKHQLIASGIRARDMALRLKYAGLAATIEPGLKASLAKAVRDTDPGDTIYILPTYTAMLELRQILATQTELKDFWS